MHSRIRPVILAIAILLVALIPAGHAAHAAPQQQPIITTVYAPQMVPHASRQIRPFNMLMSISITCSPTSIHTGGTTGCFVNYSSTVPTIPTIRVYWQDGWVTTVSFPYYIHAYGNTFYHTYQPPTCGTAHIQAQAQDPNDGEVDAYSTVTISC